MKPTVRITAAVVVAAAACGSVLTIAVRGTPVPASPAPSPVGTARVMRTDLSSTVLTGGTLGYAPSPPVVNHTAGTYTALVAAGSVVAPGQVLYRVDDQPVVLLAGAVPAWRPFAVGMTDGPDVTALAANLIALGDAGGLFSTPSPHFGPATDAALRRFQIGLGLTATGSIDDGSVVFELAPVRVDAVNTQLGQVAAPGDTPFTVTTTKRTVSVPLNPNDPPVSVGQGVSIILPTGSSTPGTVTAEGPPAPTSGSTGSSSSPSSSSSSSSAVVLTVTPTDPAATGTLDGVAVQVSLTVQSVRGVLAVPISALLALAGGGYGLEIVEPSGRHHLVGVHTGIFAGGVVEVSGRGLAAGTKVVVAQ